MKILDIPQSGKKGLNVSMGGRYGQAIRALVIPTNPRTAAQLQRRQVLSAVTEQWRTLTEAQRLAWTAAAATHQSKARLGQSGPLTGSQLFTRINCNLVLCGMEKVTDPPENPTFPELAVAGLSITNAAGVIALKLTVPADPGDYTLIRASAPRSAGRLVCNDFRFIGMCPTPAQGQSVITGLYTAKFGAPPVGSKVFVRANQVQNGYEDLPHEFVAIVPPQS